MMGFAQRPMGFAMCGPRDCCTPVRQCWREAKELLVRSSGDVKVIGQATQQDTQLATGSQQLLTKSEGYTINTGDGSTQLSEAGTKASDDAVIGGGCCVHLSIEYMPDPPAVTKTQSAVEVVVRDTKGAVLTWSKAFEGGYHVQEGIISTYPGAVLRVGVVNAIARVRWCEVFSC